MKKITNFISNNKKKIMSIFVILVLVGFCYSGNVFAKINSSSHELGSSTEDWVIEIVGAIMDAIGGIATGSVMKLIQVLIIAVAGIVMLLIITIWSKIVGGGLVHALLDMPWPDRIVFNKMAIFDPNFINPTPNNQLRPWAEDSNIIQYFVDPVQSIYFTFFMLAGLLMVVAALIIGIKLAVTSIASERAQYKETLNKWIIGMVTLFSLHFIILGIFTLNEEICEIASKAVDSFSITIDMTQMNLVTKAVNGIYKFFSSTYNFFTGSSVDTDLLKYSVSGLGGIYWYYLWYMIFSSDILPAIVFLAITGQMINLIVHYFKRFFYTIFLAMVAPLVVAADVVKRVL